MSSGSGSPDCFHGRKFKEAHPDAGAVVQAGDGVIEAERAGEALAIELEKPRLRVAGQARRDTPAAAHADDRQRIEDPLRARSLTQLQRKLCQQRTRLLSLSRQNL